MIDLRPGCEYVFFCGNESCGNWNYCKKTIIFEIKKGVPRRPWPNIYKEYHYNEIKWIFMGCICRPIGVTENWQGEFCEL